MKGRPNFRNRTVWTKRKTYQKGRKADYKGATPEQVAKAVLRYRPPAARPRSPEKGNK